MDDNAMTYRPKWSERLRGQFRYAAGASEVTEVPETTDAPPATQENTVIAPIDVARLWRERVARRLPPMPPLPRWAIPVIIVVVVALLLPSVVAAASAYQDYATLKNLGESGMRHLLNAKKDLSGVLDGVSSNSDSLASLLNSGDVLADAPYTFFMQRQGGTENQANITIHPASNMPKSLKTTTYKQVIDTNTPLTLGGKKPPTTKATPTPTATPGGAASSSFTFDPVAINRAIAELHAAQSDFQQLRNRLGHPDWVLSLAPHMPGVGSQVDTAATLANIGYDVASLGVVLADASKPLIQRLYNASLAGNGNSELLTQSDVKSLQSGLTQGQVIFTRIQQELSAVQVNSLPISADQKQQLSEAIQLMPNLNGIFTQASDYLDMIAWLAGADAPRHFLVQTLDNGELRGTGGFEGFYSILTIDHGKISPITLLRANDLDYGKAGCGKGVNNWAIANPAPPAYVKWWPFANWGLRDANLNSDFPTSAKLIMDAYSHEACSKVDGVIQFTPEAIASVLRVTGPLTVPLFNEKVTADNLEAKIHYYEENEAGIARAQALFHDYNPAHRNKIRTRFTEAVETLLETHVRHLPKSELIPLAKQFLADLRSKEVQIYFNNKAVEAQLQKLHADGAIDTTSGIDGLFVSQVNVSISKASPYIATTINDDIRLDAKGGATHHLTISLKNNVVSYTQVAGFLTYRDYVRIYVPAGARLQYADGFDTGKLMCIAPSPPTTDTSKSGDTSNPSDPSNPSNPSKPITPVPPAPICSSYPYPSGERVCPAGRYLPYNDSQGNYIVQPGNAPGTLNEVGWPTATKSDVPGLTMWGGYVVIPQ
ncbi:MAG TPA: DUF4012 domain-containing protein, partial [Ktedonobacterales bacterium]|nr:DUF4012 domain-containing protein [Ktedonobacterales bacterium]